MLLSNAFVISSFAPLLSSTNLSAVSLLSLRPFFPRFLRKEETIAADRYRKSSDLSGKTANGEV